MAETWLINDSIEFGKDPMRENINFISNNQNFSIFDGGGLSLNYNTTTVYELEWIDQAYRTVTFETAPTGDLLTWLEANAVKQEEPPTKLTFDLSTLGLASGTHRVKVWPKGDGVNYRDANLALCKEVEYTAGGGKTFADMTWEEVVTACNNHTLSSVPGAVVGATKNITIEGIDYPFVILGFEHDTLTTPDTHGTKAHCTFQMLHCYKTAQKMNNTSTSTGGWGASALRTYLNGTFKGLLPATIANATKSIHKPYLAVRSSGTISYSDDTVYIPSEYEIFGVGRPTSGATHTSDYVYAYNTEGTQYPYYQQSPIPTGFTQIGNTGSFTGNGGSYTNRYGENKTTTNNWVYNYNAVRGLTGSSGETPLASTYCWESSPFFNSTDSFCYATTDGYANAGAAGREFGIAPVFSL